MVGINNAMPPEQAAKILEFQESAYNRQDLARLMWGYRNDPVEYVQDRVCPFFNVPQIRGKYRVLDERTMFQIPDVSMGRQEHPKESTWGDSFQNYTLDARAQSVFLPDVERAEAAMQYTSVAQWRKINVEFKASQMRNDREKKVLDLITTSGNYAAGFTTTLSGVNQWSSLNTSTPDADVVALSKQLLAPLTHIVVDAETHYILLQHPAVRATIVGGATKGNMKQAIIDNDDLARYFRVKPGNYIVAGARYDSTPESATSTLSYMMGKFCVLMHLNENVGGNDLIPTFCRTLLLQSMANSTTGYKVKSVRDEIAGMGGENLLMGYWASEKIIAQKLGALIIDTVA